MKKTLFSLAVVGLCAVSTPVHAQENATQPNRVVIIAVDQNSDPLTATDRRFMELAYQSNRMEVELSRLALKRAQSPDVRRFATMMISEHAEANAYLRRLAFRNNLMFPDDLYAPHKTVMSQLTGLDGNAFDNAYLSLMDQAHQQDLALLKQAAGEVQNPIIKSYVQNMTTVVGQHHQTLAQYRRTGRMPSVSQLATLPTIRQSDTF